MYRITALFLLVILASCGHRSDSGAQKVSPEQLLLDVQGNERFASVDQVAGWIINKDPSIVLVDVRAAADFQKFTLPGAINIPLDQLLTPDSQQKLDCSKYTPLFFSNDDVRAEQAWMLQRRNGCASCYIMAGGLNEWTTAILQPQEPAQTASAAEFERYNFRKAACKYFTGGSKALEAEPFAAPVAEKPAAKKAIVPKAKPVVEEEEEGC